MSRTDYIIVSVCCITYNHVGFISDALDGFLMQSTNFPLEVIVHDDASTDGTADVIREYERRHPDVIKPIYQTENQYSKGIRVSATHVWPRARGKYIALCEGDDYWTDPLKLQKQVDLLDAQPEYAMCFHWTNRLVQATAEMEIAKWPRRRKPYYTLDDILSDTIHVPTASMMFRVELITDLPDWYFTAPVGDWPLLVLLAERGKLGLIDEIMSVYRVHKGGVWSGTDTGAHKKIGNSILHDVEMHLGPRYERMFRIGASKRYLDKAAHSAHLGDIRSARMYLIDSIRSAFSLQGPWMDQTVMFGRLYLPGLYRPTKALLSKVRSPFMGPADSIRNSE